jgi:hypothetical protein
LRRAALLLPLALAVSACGSSGRDVLRDASANVGKIRSGTLHAKLLVQPHVVGAKNPFGFTIDGPFTFGDRLTTNVTYVQIANGRRGSARLVLDENGGYVVSNGQRRTLAGAQLDDLRRTMRAVRAGGSIVDVSDWVKSSHSADCPPADAPVKCVEGDLDPVAAIDGLAALAQLTGTSGLADADAKTLRKAVSKATYFVMAGKDDHLLRDLKIDVELSLDVPESLKGALGKLVGADMTFELAVKRPRS